MTPTCRKLLVAGLLLGSLSSAHAGPVFGARASGSELDSPGIEVDGGPGSTSASINEVRFRAAASFSSASTFLPGLTAFANNLSHENDDDITSAEAEAYQVFNSRASPTILDINLHGVITGDAWVLANVYVRVRG